MIGVHVGGCRRRWTPVVHGRQLRAVLCGKVLVLGLVRGGLDVLLVFRLQFARGGVRRNAAFAVEADVIVVDDGVLRNDGAVLVDVGYVHAAKVSHGAVVRERSTAPLAADEAYAAETEAVVNATIEAHVRAPIAAVPSVGAADKAPVAGSPENADSRRLHPNAGNPVVARVTVAPVAGGPEIARGGQWGLHVHRQNRRSHVHGDTDPDADLRVRDWQGEHGRSQRGGDEQPAES